MMVVQGQPRQIVSETPSLPIKLGVVICASHSMYERSIIERIMVQTGSRLFKKGLVQYLKCRVPVQQVQALSSNPGTEK
jgi:hypothetical protein